MKHDHKPFAGGIAAVGGRASSSAIAGAYRGDTADRIRRFLPMVRRLAWHVHGTGRPGIELDDLIQAGLVALTECAQRHVGPGEDGFAAYAKMRVRGAMVDLIRRTVPLSRGAVERRRQLRDTESALRSTLGRDPTSSELATALVERATLRSRTAKTVASRGALRKVLEDARVGGVAFDLEENDDGVVCIGTPLFLDGRVVAAISVSVPSTRYTSALGEEIRQSLTALDRQFRTMRGSPLRHAPST